MLRHRLFLLAVVSILVLVLSGCAGSDGESSQDVQPDSTNDTADIIVCPDGLVLWEEHGVCAPRVDECEAWEVPVVGGGCMAVGPRGCSKLWDPDADVDCEPGELLPCPEGFVETEDGVACIPHFDDDCGEMEIPVLGGGCQKVGPDWGEAGEPYFDECLSGHLALEGGDCVQVGPRACPKLWDPDADVDCEVGDVLPCLDGWIESEDGMYCDPGYDECSHGERPLVGGGCERVIPLPGDCPAGPFPAAPDGAADVLYVLAASQCGGECGSEAAPYPSIQAAVDAAPSGAAVLVGPGTYDEGLTLTKPVHVVGLCASLVEVTGKGLVLPDGDSKVMEAGVGVFDAQGVALSGLRIRSPTAGIAIVGATDVVLNDLDIAESHGVALYVDSGSNVQASDLWIHDTEIGSGQMDHDRGVWVGGGASLEAQAVLVEKARRTGIEVVGEGTLLDLTECVIRNTNPDSSGNRGRGIQAQEGCTVSVTGSLLDENSEIGLAVFQSGTEVEVFGTVIRKTLTNENGDLGWGIQAVDGCTVLLAGSLLEENTGGSIVVVNSGTKVEVFGSVIRKTLPYKDGELGWGIWTSSGCKAVVTGSLLEENGEIGLAVFGSGTEVSVFGSVIRKTLADGNGEAGKGIQADEGCTVSVAGSLLEENRGCGLVVAHSGTEVEVSGSVIRKTMPNENGEDGWGIKASGSCMVSLAGSLLEENRLVGLVASDSGTEVDVSGSVIRKTMPNDNEKGGKGIQAQEGCTVSVTGSLLEENREFGLVVFHSGTEVDVSGSVIRKTLSNENGEFGGGILAAIGCTVSVTGSLLEDNRAGGFVVHDSGTEVDVSGSVIRKTMPDENGEFGRGIQAQDGCTVSVAGSLLEENRSVGLAVFNSGTEVEVFSSVIRKTLPDENEEGGRGIYADEGCTVSVAGSLLEENREVGLAVFGSGTEVDVSGSVIRKTMPNDNEKGGSGVQAQEGSTVSVAGSLLEENRGVGLLVAHSGTEVEVSGSVIRKTMPNENGEFGRGIEAQEGSTVSVAGSLLEENREVGLVAAHFGTEVEISGSVIRKTLPDNGGMHGNGLFVQDGASGTVSWCRIEGNSTVGISAWGRSEGPGRGEPSLLHMENSAVLNTKKGGAPGRGDEVFGDGLIAAEGAELQLDSVVVMDNARAGAYYHESVGGMSNTVIAGNGSYGLAMESCDQYVDYSDAFSFGNVLEAITTRPLGLPVPPPPEFDMEPLSPPWDLDE